VLRRLASKSGFLGTQGSDFQRSPDLDIPPDLVDDALKVGE
jgi:hypothetical protein